MKDEIKKRTIAAPLTGMFFGVLIAVFAGSVLAQGAATTGATQSLVPISPEEQDVIEALSSGKVSFLRGDLPSTQAYFEEAFVLCDEHDVQGTLLAKTYMSLGALFVGFLQKEPQGVEFMKIALGIDQQVRPDSEFLNEPVAAAYTDLRERLGLGTREMAGGGSNIVSSVKTGFWVLKHDPISAAKRMHPLGIFIETNPLVAINTARLYFRLPGDRNFLVTDMMRNGQLFGMIIGCETFALLDPQGIYYYIEVEGGDGNVVGRVGDAENPVKIQMVETDRFTGEQPNLPGMAPSPECVADDVQACPPWDPHCKDMPCVTTEDCLGGNTCQDGYCMAQDGAEEDDSHKAVGMVFSIGAGGGGGYNAAAGTGAPSPLFLRLQIGYYILENLHVGFFGRFQNIFTDGPDNQHGKIAGIMYQADEFAVPGFDYAGPMWGPTATLFLYGDGKAMGPGHVTDREGNLVPSQGMRIYSRLEVTTYGMMFHQTDADVITTTKDEDGDETEEIAPYPVQHPAGPWGAGIGFGMLWGLHRNIDLGFEVMADFMFGDFFAFNADGQIQIQFHF